MPNIRLNSPPVSSLEIYTKSLRISVMFMCPPPQICDNTIFKLVVSLMELFPPYDNILYISPSEYYDVYYMHTTAEVKKSHSLFFKCYKVASTWKEYTE